jgi:hypothetical protein
MKQFLAMVLACCAATLAGGFAMAWLLSCAAGLYCLGVG